MTDDNGSAIAKVWNDPSVLAGLHQVGSITVDTAIGFARARRIAARTGSGYAVGIRLREGGEFLGWVELRRHATDAHSAELTIELHSEFRGHGYAAEAARRLIDWAFANLPLRRVVGLVLPDNDNSKRLMVRIGMTLVGTSPIPSSRTGDLVDCFEYERLTNGDTEPATPVSRCPACEHPWSAHSDDGCEVGMLAPSAERCSCSRPWPRLPGEDVDSAEGRLGRISSAEWRRLCYGSALVEVADDLDTVSGTLTDIDELLEQLAGVSPRREVAGVGLTVIGGVVGQVRLALQDAVAAMAPVRGVEDDPPLP